MTWELIGWGSLSGFLIHTANNFIACGIVNGYGGPAQAITATHSLWATIITSFYENKPLSDYQTAALVSGFLGVCIIATGDILKDKLCGLCKKIIIMKPG
jgi:drug/metabolite transporter (DMT)-like permease